MVTGVAAALFSYLSFQSGGLATPEPLFRRPPQAVAGDKAVKIFFLRTRYADDDPSMVSHQVDQLERSAARIDYFFRRQSYGLFSVANYEISPVVRVAAKKDYAQIQGSHDVQVFEVRKPLERDAIDAINSATNRKIGQIFDFVCIMAKRPGWHNHAYVASKLAFFPNAPNEYAFFHELGHCMGFGHSNALVSQVAGESLPDGDSRYLLGYGDHGSAMGQVDFWAYSLVERYTMGWIANSDKFPRYIKKFDWGETTFVSHDQEAPKGLVGGYVEGKFGVEACEYNRDKTKRVHVPGSSDATQRLWFSLITCAGAERNFADLPRPYLTAHITGTVFGNRQGLLLQDHRTTVQLDLSPTGEDWKNMRPPSKGLFEGQTATIRQTDGSSVQVKFLRYEPTERRAVIDLRLIPSVKGAG